MVVARGERGKKLNGGGARGAKINGKQEVTSPKKVSGRPETGSDVTKKGVFVYIYNSVQRNFV